MSDFFAKNSRVRAGAPRYLAAFAGLVGLATVLFLLPHEMTGPVGRWLDKRGAVGGSLKDIFQTLRDQEEDAKPRKRPPRDSRDPGKDTVGMVVGGAALAPELGTAVKAPPGGKSVAGIMGEEELAQQPGGVAIRKDELGGERAGQKGAAFAAPGFFDKGRPAGTQVGEQVSAALDRFGAEDVGRGKLEGGAPGRLSKAAGREMSKEVVGNLGKPRGAAGNRAFAQLAATYARVSPALEGCSGQLGCAGEGGVAAVNSGFDGSRPPSMRRDLTQQFPETDGQTPPQMTDAAAMADEARRLERAVKACTEADAKAAPVRQETRQVMEKRAGEFRQASCDTWLGWVRTCQIGTGPKRLAACLMSKAPAAKSCEKGRAEFYQACWAYNRVECEQAKFCPLKTGEQCSPVDCDALLVRR